MEGRGRSPRRERGRSRRSESRSPSRSRSRSPPRRRRSPRRSRSRSPPRRSESRGRSEHRSRSPAAARDGAHPWDSDKKDKDAAPEEAPKEQPNFQTSGLLTAETNTFKGVVIKYNEPQDAQIPKVKWRLHVFKDDGELPIIHLYRQSAYLIGRERQVCSSQLRVLHLKICEIPLDHPSISKQHAG